MLGGRRCVLFRSPLGKVALQVRASILCVARIRRAPGLRRWRHFCQSLKQWASLSSQLYIPRLPPTGSLVFSTAPLYCRLSGSPSLSRSMRKNVPTPLSPLKPKVASVPHRPGGPLVSRRPGAKTRTRSDFRSVGKSGNAAAKDEAGRLGGACVRRRNVDLPRAAEVRETRGAVLKRAHRAGPTGELSEITSRVQRGE